MTATIENDAYEHYLAHLLRGERLKCADIVRHLVSQQVPLRQLYLELFQKSMYEVGEHWAANSISVATEHMATAITAGLLNKLLSDAPYEPAINRKVVVAGVQPELHQLGSRIVADTLEMKGWDSLYVGANTPTTELIRLIRETNPDIVAITLTMYFNQSALRMAIEQIRRTVPDQHIVIGGQGLKDGVSWLEERGGRVTHIGSLDELDSFLGDFD